jgi:uncharacterized repeat protein (TIGR02059 family)
MNIGLALGINNTLAPPAAPADTTPPTLSTAAIPSAGTTLVLTYNEALDTGSTPAAGAFSLSGTARTVSSVAVSGSAVTLTLSGAVAIGATVTVSYTAGGAPIRDVAGNNAANLSSQAVTNNSTDDQTAPTLSSAAVASDGLSLVLTYSEALDTGSVPAAGDFTLGNFFRSTISSVGVSGSAVTLTFGAAVGSIETSLTVSYTPGTNKIRDASSNHNLAASLSSQAVTNNSTFKFTPAIIMGTNCVEWWRPDLGNTIASDGNWVGQVGGVTWAQATSGSRPTQNATGGPNSTAAMTFDGVDDNLTCTLVRAAPGTTPAVVWLIMKQISWTANEAICNDASATFAILQRTASPQLAMSATSIVNNNSGLAVSGTPWGRVQAYFSNSSSDELLCIATAVSTAGAGNTAGTAPRLGMNGSGSGFGNFGLADVAFFKAKPTGATLTLLNAYVTDRYGSGLV